MYYRKESKIFVNSVIQTSAYIEKDCIHLDAAAFELAY